MNKKNSDILYRIILGKVVKRELVCVSDKSFAVHLSLQLTSAKMEERMYNDGREKKKYIARKRLRVCSFTWSVCVSVCCRKFS